MDTVIDKLHPSDTTAILAVDLLMSNLEGPIHDLIIVQVLLGVPASLALERCF